MIKIFSHNDLDGMGCIITGAMYFKPRNINYEILYYSILDERIQEYINNKEYNQYELTYITDLSISEETAEMLNNVNSQGHKVIIVDHHEGSSFLNEQYPQISKCNTDNDKSGALLFFEELYKDSTLCHEERILKEYVTYVSSYDTWKWTETNDKFAERLNVHFDIYKNRYKYDKYIREMYRRIVSDEPLIFTAEQNEISYYISQRDKYIYKQQFKLIKTRKDEYNVGLLFIDDYASPYISIISETLNKKPENQDMDFLMLVNLASGFISFRTIKDNIDLDKIAAKYGGGGHEKAAGTKLENDFIQPIVDLVLSPITNN